MHRTLEVVPFARCVEDADYMRLPLLTEPTVREKEGLLDYFDIPRDVSWKYRHFQTIGGDP